MANLSARRTGRRRSGSPAPQRAGGRAERSAARRAAILAAALDEFASRGFEAARLDDVARRAGVAKGTIYLHFADKESLFQELIRLELSPVVGALKALSQTGLPLPQLGEMLAEVFVREIIKTRRKDVIRLIITEGPRFPKLAEFYHREVIVHIMALVRGMLRQAVERGELKHESLLRFPHILAAPGMVAILWSGLFDRFDPLDVSAMLRAHFAILFGSGGPR